MQIRLTQTNTALYIQAIGVGLLLGLMQLLLLLQGLERLGWRLSLVVGLLFYVFIPLVAAMRTAQQGEKILRGLVADWLTGAVASLAFLFPFLLNLLTTARSSAASHQIPQGNVQVFSFAVATLLALLFTSFGMILAIVGGACGRAIGKKWKQRLAR